MFSGEDDLLEAARHGNGVADVFQYLVPVHVECQGYLRVLSVEPDQFFQREIEARHAVKTAFLFEYIVDAVHRIPVFFHQIDDEPGIYVAAASRRHDAFQGSPAEADARRDPVLQGAHAGVAVHHH
jgi:hypothetical protein